MSKDDLVRRGDALKALCEKHPRSLGAIATIAALPAVTVGVKPLVWRSNGKGRICADTPFGLYEIEHGRYGMRLLHSGSFMQDDLQGIDAAKAAAQADYEARILAALEPVAAPDPAAIREAALHVENAKRLRRYDWQEWTAQDVEDAEGIVRAFLALIPKGAADDR